MKLTNQVAPALKTVKELEEEVKKELGDKTMLRGNREKGEREDAPGATRQSVPVEGEVDGGSTGAPGIFDDLD
jgi:hypothetical protein